MKHPQLRLLPAVFLRTVATGITLAALAACSATAQPATNPDAATLQDFQKRLGAYVALQRGLQRDTAKQTETADPSKISVAENLLAARVRSVRKDAKQGDIFTPPIAAVFRRLMNPELQGKEGRDTKGTLKEDAPVSVPLAANIDYPSAAALPTMPGNLLAVLPQLPEAVEYRIIGKTLILRDVDANIIVDYIPNAIQ